MHQNWQSDVSPEKEREMQLLSYNHKKEDEVLNKISSKTSLKNVNKYDESEGGALLVTTFYRGFLKEYPRDLSRTP